MRLLETPFFPGQVPWTLRILFTAQIFTVFMTGTKLVPGIRNNVGAFELVGLLVFLFFFAQRHRFPERLAVPIVIRLLLLMSLAATVSLLRLPADRARMGIVQTLLLFFLFLFVLVFYNLMLRYQISPSHLLRLVTYAALIIGPWVLFSGVASGGGIQAAGPFRNRAHMANYMLTAFWLVLLYSFWPGIRKRERWISYLALASALYPVAVSGRRSVYLSLILGLACVCIAFLTASRGRRANALIAAIVILSAGTFFYTVGGKWLPQLEFFQARVGGIGDRLEQAAGGAGAAVGESNFFILQREGVVQAFLDSPIIGIGWGGFYRSQYSPTGHEVHSTPMRFLAEMGVVGILLYAALMGTLLLGSLRILALVRHGPLRMPALVLTIALWSLSLSWVYNRHITERTFWLLLVVYLTFEALATSLRRRAQPQQSETRIAAASRNRSRSIAARRRRAGRSRSPARPLRLPNAHRTRHRLPHDRPR